MKKASLLALIKEARSRAEAGDLDISSQQLFIKQIEEQGLPTEKARAVLARLIQDQEVDLTEMVRLLDIMDEG